MSRRSGRIEAAKDGPRVVVQQVLQVEPPAPELPAAQEPPPEDPQTTEKPELKTRLRPNRSSWRQRFSPPPPSKTKVKREDRRSSKESQSDTEVDDGMSDDGPEIEAEPELVVPDTLEEVVRTKIEEAVEPMETETETEEVAEPNEQEEELEEVIAEEESETDRICAVVQQDALIQQFGLNLVNMSTQPNSRATILAVSQRMIELVRLLRAAQGMDPNIDSLAALFHVDQWPLIVEAIKYVAGWEESGAKNPQYIYDVGQALRFCAFMLKREAQENENLAYEQQAQQFFDSIQTNMSSILMQQPVTICTEAEAVPAVAEVVAEVSPEQPNQYRVVLGTSTGDSQPVTLSLQVGGDNMPMPGTVQVVKIISTPSGKKGIIIPTRILSKKV